MQDINSFEGKWWFPNHPTEILDGIIEISQNDESFLRVSGTLSQPIMEIYNDDDVILLGILNDERKVTVLASKRHSEMKGLVTVKITYYLNFIFIGMHFDSQQDIKFEGVILAFSNLEKWFYRPRLFDLRNDNQKIFSYGKPIKFESLGNKINIGIYSHVSCIYERELRKYKISSSIFAKIKLIRDKTLFDYLETSSTLLDLFNFVCGHPVTISEITGFVREHGKNMVSVKIIYRSPIREKMNKIVTMIPYDLIFEVLSDKIVNFVKSWFRLKNDVGASYNLLFGFIYNPELYLSNRLLMLSGGIESYHKLYMEKLSPIKKERTERIERILALIDSVPMKYDDNDWLVGMLKLSNTVSFKQRIVETYERFSDIIPKMSTGFNDKCKFAKKVRDYRNDFAHGEITYDEVENEELFWTIERLHLLLKLQFLSYLQFTNSQILDLLIPKIPPRILTDEEFQDLCKLL